MVEMVPADMRRAAAAWDSASEQVEKANPVGRVDEIATAMPRGASARQVGSFIGAVETRFDEWCTDATRMGETYRAVAEDHHAADQFAGDQGRVLEGEVSNLLGIWTPGATPGPTVRGPALFDPGAPKADRQEDLITRLGKVDP